MEFNVKLLAMMYIYMLLFKIQVVDTHIQIYATYVYINISIHTHIYIGMYLTVSHK